ncbi:MAG: hypothetical protein FWD99_05180 [Oscillospiraceae bacterium]|nr:hypothetical protein [Oscillospiraceae bacterium]
MIKKINIFYILYVVAAALLPNIFLFFLYAQNVSMNHLRFGHVLVLATLLAVIGTMGFAALWILSKNMQMALLLSVLSWVFFWFYESLMSLFHISGMGKYLALGVFLVVILAVAVVSRLRSIKYPNIAITLFNALAGVVCLLFVFNLFSALIVQRTNTAPEMVFDGNDAPEFYVRRDFNINPNLPNPDIYWIHLDGMTSLRTVERFWDECQEHVRYELAKRNFIIDESAYLRNAAGTHIAVPMYLSPAFYDSYFGIILNAIDEGFGWEVREQLYPIVEGDNVCLYEDVALYFELFAALLAAGYDIQGINDWWQVVDISRTTGAYRYYSRIRQLWNDFLRTDLPQTLEMTTPLNFYILNRLFFGNEEERLQREGEVNAASPAFTWRYYEETHAMRWHYLDPDTKVNAETRLDLYPLAFEQIVTSMLNAVDEILERNPNAVIILQSDHGFHREYTHRHMDAEGIPREISMELTHSVFSAVHIPDAYGGLDAPIAPLNIVRELVNRFVGPNYELIIPHTNPND